MWFGTNIPQLRWNCVTFLLPWKERLQVFQNFDEFVQKHKTSNFQKTPYWHPHIICYLWEEFTPLFIEYKIYAKKESNSWKEKVVFIKFETACVGRFHYPLLTSDLIDTSLRLAQSITRNGAERTPPRRSCVLVSADKNLHTAPVSAGRVAQSV
jgi:hypothetical protein